MVGKTNLTFISKGDSSSVQLVQKSYATDATGEIYKMEVIHSRFFAFVGSASGKKNVLMGTDAGNMSFVRKDNELLEATHIIYTEEKYYFVKCGDSCTEIYGTADFKEYGQVNLSGLSSIEEKWLGIFIDSRGKVILVSYIYDSSTYKDFKIYVCESLKDIENAQISQGTVDVKDAYNTCLINNRIFFPDGRQVSLAGTVVLPDKDNGSWNRCNYAEGYFFQIGNPSGSIYYLYRSRDLITVTKYSYQLEGLIKYSKARVIPVNGKCCLLYTGYDGTADYPVNYINIADDILRVGHSDNVTIERADELDITSVLEDGEKTYAGTSNGIIYEFQLDYDGTTQRPDVAIIRTLAAKQALLQSIQYTDDCIKELKNYIDQKIKDEPLIIEDNSTSVELEKNGS